MRCTQQVSIQSSWKQPNLQASGNGPVDTSYRYGRQGGGYGAGNGGYNSSSSNSKGYDDQPSQSNPQYSRNYSKEDTRYPSQWSRQPATTRAAIVPSAVVPTSSSKPRCATCGLNHPTNECHCNAPSHKRVPLNWRPPAHKTDLVNLHARNASLAGMDLSMPETVDTKNARLARQDGSLPRHAAQVNIAKQQRQSQSQSAPTFAQQQCLQDRQRMERIEQLLLDRSQLNSSASSVFSMAASATEISSAQALAAILQLTQQRDVAEAKNKAASINSAACDQQVFHDFIGMEAIEVPTEKIPLAMHLLADAGFQDMSERLSAVNMQLQKLQPGKTASPCAGSSPHISRLPAPSRTPKAFTLDQALNVASRYLVTFAPRTDGTAAAQQERDMYRPQNAAFQPTSSTSAVPVSAPVITGIRSDLQPLLAAAARKLVLTQGGEHRLTETEEQLLRFLQAAGFIDNNTLMLAEYQSRPIPKHVVGKRLILAWLPPA